MRRLQLTGQRFGRLAVAAFAGTRRVGRFARVTVWDVVCDCGKALKVDGYLLKSGNTKSCGCFKSSAEVADARLKALPLCVTHGQARVHKITKAYRAWQSMRQRCYNPKMSYFRIYGGRGISVCPEWNSSFERFFKDMGNPPTPSHSLDRFPNPDGNYEPGNCRWATPTQQSNNKSARKVS